MCSYQFYHGGNKMGVYIDGKYYSSPKAGNKWYQKYEEDIKELESGDD